MTEGYKTLWLAAIDGPIPEEEARIYWNVKEDPTPVLDAALRRADYLYVGSWGARHESEGLQSGRCPAVRIFDWLFFKGTIDRYQALLLDEELLSRLMELSQPRPGDLPTGDVPPTGFDVFLRHNAGRYLLPEEAPPA
ncbi:hypothetical protein LKL35_01490 [Streptomyces sp. ET3-23]|uniref:hypothetical protein n=1 Tax=Streptomyces sp. ET3-23 TaxID=2885643 RepID=UPI001D10E6B3|nr:hypothetical protein [Streptomyces sp. ET3-23]MCC2274121.1 hypothetical protein [Streptomyces sp. ET3-23]